jgi:hypothetical protein
MLIAALLVTATLAFLGWVLYSAGYDNGYLDGYDTAHRDMVDAERQEGETGDAP